MRHVCMGVFWEQVVSCWVAESWVFLSSHILPTLNSNWIFYANIFEVGKSPQTTKSSPSFFLTLGICGIFYCFLFFDDITRGTHSQSCAFTCFPKCQREWTRSSVSDNMGVFFLLFATCWMQDITATIVLEGWDSCGLMFLWELSRVFGGTYQ